MKPDLFDIVKSASTLADATHGHRTIHDVLAHTVSELGETAEEVNIASGISYKKPGVDGVVGEAVDVMLCLLDLIHKYDPTITKEQINALAEAKCQKWLKKLDEDANR